MTPVGKICSNELCFQNCKQCVPLYDKPDPEREITSTIGPFINNDTGIVHEVLYFKKEHEQRFYQPKSEGFFVVNGKKYVKHYCDSIVIHGRRYVLEETTTLSTTNTN